MTGPQPRRRDFVRAMALGVGGATGLIGQSAPAAEDDPKDAPQPTKTEADARMELVLARFGGQLDEAARKVIRAEIEGHVRRARELRAFPLENGDGPLPVFHPYRAPLS